MYKQKEITFLIKVMNGGGAERVISILSEALVLKAYKVNLILTHQRLEEADLRNVHEKINVISLEDEVKTGNRMGLRICMFYARLMGKLSMVFLRKNSETGLIYKYHTRNHQKVRWLKKYFNKHSRSTIIAFLYDSIFLSLLASTTENRLIISERGDPQQSIGSKTTMAFLHKKFKNADKIVFQSPDVRKWYLENIHVDGQVILNPIKKDLPTVYEGKRNKKIVNFCRISTQKNLELLIDAFSLLCGAYPEYELYIYGDAVGNGAEGYLEIIKHKINESKVLDKIHLLPGCRDIHEKIKDYAMFVSSSDFEGMSNSMLESMAIGLPTICTDCPAGGARAVIKDHENGILVPVGDAEQMYLAMKEVIDNPELAKKLSKNGSKIREELAVENIIEKWMEIIND